MEPIKTINYKNHTINVFNDENPDSPRTDDNLAEFHCCHRRYNLGDDGFNYHTGADCIEVAKQAEKHGDIVLPLYLYDHSGITISLSPFSCPWDSGQVGYVRAEILNYKHYNSDGYRGYIRYGYGYGYSLNRPYRQSRYGGSLKGGSY